MSDSSAAPHILLSVSPVDRGEIQIYVSLNTDYNNECLNEWLYNPLTSLFYYYHCTLCLFPQYHDLKCIVTMMQNAESLFPGSPPYCSVAFVLPWSQQSQLPL